MNNKRKTNVEDKTNPKRQIQQLNTNKNPVIATNLKSNTTTSVNNNTTNTIITTTSSQSLKDPALLKSELIAQTHKLTANRKIKLGVCTMNQWAMDFEGNKNRIIESIKKCVSEECSIRIGPELEITGYSCEDHFLEKDTQLHCWEVIRDIIEEDLTDKILVDLGTIVEWNGALYNCRIFIYKKKIIMIRPKCVLADDGNYREGRWFTAWSKDFSLHNFILPKFIQEITNQVTTKIGVGIMSFNDCAIASEICEEVWVSDNPSNHLCLAGAEIIINNSGSYFLSSGKHKTRTDFLNVASLKNGGCYIYSNLIGCDGGRLFFDGGSFVSLNGKLIAEGKQCYLLDFEVVTAIVDLEEIAKKRINSRSRCTLSSKAKIIESIIINEDLCNSKFDDFYNSDYLEPSLYGEEQLTIQAISSWMFDYLRKSNGSGFFLPLSGGSDSGCVAVLVGYMCRMIFYEIKHNNNEFVLNQLRKIVKNESYYPTTEQEICSKILFTAYLSTKNNSNETRASAKAIAEEIGSNHLEIDIDSIFSCFKESIFSSIGFTAKFKSEGGSEGEDLSLQNLQSRIRMVCSYLLSQIAPLTGKHDLKGFLIMLASGNLDEAQLGYLTKYDCSSGDINPIGSLSKTKLKNLLYYFNQMHNYSSINLLLSLKPSAELRPLDENNPNAIQTDEEDLGFKYEELNLLNVLRLNNRCGPYSMFKYLLSKWKHFNDEEIKDKVKKYFWRYSVNRHKTTVLTPSVFLNSNCNDDNRYDLRPFLYNSFWKYQFDEIEALISKRKADLEKLSNDLENNNDAEVEGNNNLPLNESKVTKNNSNNINLTNYVSNKHSLAVFKNKKK